MKLIISSILIGLVSTSLIACTVDPTPKPQKSIQEKMSQLDKETKALIGSASCTTNKQCHGIGFGDKACGGFMSFRVYSDQNTDISQLKKTVDRYNKLSEQWNRENNIVSTCDYLMPPQLNCKQQTCQIK